MLALAYAATLAGAAAPQVSAAAIDVSSQRSLTVVLAPAQMFRMAETAEAKLEVPTASAIYAALQQDPNADVRAEARFRLAKMLMRQSRTREAAELLRQVLDDKPNAA